MHCGVDVLELIDQHVLEAAAEGQPDLRVALAQHHRPEQRVAEVGGAELKSRAL